MTATEFKNLPKEVQYFFGTSCAVAFMLFCTGIDSIVDGGFWGIILGTLNCILLGMICGAAVTFIYMIANAIAPKKTQEFIQKMNKEPEDMDIDEE